MTPHPIFELATTYICCIMVCGFKFKSLKFCTCRVQQLKNIYIVFYNMNTLTLVECVEPDLSFSVGTAGDR